MEARPRLDAIFGVHVDHPKVPASSKCYSINMCGSVQVHERESEIFGVHGDHPPKVSGSSWGELPCKDITRDLIPALSSE
jgi:hypothetical protein